MTWQFLVYLSGGTVDLCSYSGKSLVQEKSIRIEDGGFDKDLKPTRGTAGWEVAYSPALLASLLSQTARPKVEIKKDGAFVFTGLLRPTDDFGFSNSLDTFPMEAVDFGDLLDQRTGTALSFAGVVSRSAGGADSVVHRLATLLTTSVTILTDDNLTALANFACTADEPVGDVLTGVLVEHRMTYRFDEQGRLVVRNLPAATSAATFGDQAGNLDIDNGTLRMKRLDSVEDSVEVTYQTVHTISQGIRYNNDAPGWAALGQNASLDKTINFSPVSGAIIFYQGTPTWWIEGYTYPRGGVKFGPEKIGTVSVHDNTWFASKTEDRFGAVVSIRCAAPIAGWAVKSLKVVADYSYSVAEKPAKSVGSAGVYKKVTARFLFDDTAAQAYSDLLKSRLAGGAYTFAWASSTPRSIGDVVTLNVSRDGVSAIVLITGRKWNRAAMRYEYQGIKYSTITVNTVTVPDVDVSNPIVYQIESDVSQLNRAVSGTLVPTSVTFTASQSQSPGGVTPYLGTIKIYETPDGSTWNLVSTSAAASRTASWSPGSTAKAVRAELWTDAGDYLREVRIAIVADGATGGTGPIGPANQRTAKVTLYKWASSAPSSSWPSGNTVYTWAGPTWTDPTLNGWSRYPGAGSAGQTLYAVDLVITDALTTATSSGTWSGSPTPYAVGGAGLDGATGPVNFAWAKDAVTTFDSITVGRTSGSGWGTGKLWSKDGYATAFVAATIAPDVTQHTMLALDTNPSVRSDWQQYALVLYVANGVFYAMYSGAWMNAGSPIGTCAVGDVVQITYDGSTVAWIKNGVVITYTTMYLGPLYGLWDMSGPGSHFTYPRFGPMGPKGGTGATGATGPTGAPGVNAPSVQVQYSADGSSWHSTATGSDLYFRNSTDGGTTWGAAMYVKGNTGAAGATGPGMWTPNLTNLVMDNSTTFRKSGGAAWNSQVYSSEGFDSCVVKWKFGSVPVDIMVGLNNLTDITGIDYTTIDHCWYANGSGYLQVYESGTPQNSNVGPYIGSANFGTYDATTALKITYDGSYVRYYKNETLCHQVARAGATLYLDSSFYTANCQINDLYFGRLIVGTEIMANSIDADRIKANSITATQIAAGAITSSKLLIKSNGGALNLDPYCMDTGAWWNLAGTGYFDCRSSGGDSVEGDTMLYANHCHVASYTFPVSTSKKYTARAWVKRDGINNGGAYLRIYWYNASGANISATGSPGDGTTPGTTWELRSHPQESPPVGAVSASVVVILAWTGSGYQYAQGVRCEEVIQSVLIEDGTITTNKLNVTDVFGVNAEFKGKLTGAYGSLGPFASRRLASGVSYAVGTARSTVFGYIASLLPAGTESASCSGSYGGSPFNAIVFTGQYELTQVANNGTGTLIYAVANDAATLGSILYLDSIFNPATIASDLLPLRGASSLGTSGNPWQRVYSYLFQLMTGGSVDLGATGVITTRSGARTFSDGVSSVSSNSSGGYMKFSDGSMICWGTASCTCNNSYDSGKWWYSNGVVAGFPAAFYYAPLVLATIRQLGFANSGGTTTSQTTVNGMVPSSAATQNVDWIAIGRWAA